MRYGLMLRKSKNNVVAEYALRNSTMPTGIAEWTTTITTDLPRRTDLGPAAHRRYRGRARVRSTRICSPTLQNSKRTTRSTSRHADNLEYVSWTFAYSI